MTTSTIDTDTIKRAAAKRWPEILSTLGNCPGELLDGKHHPCPRCGGVDRFRMIHAEAGAVYCNQCFNEKNGDGIAALRWLTGWDFKATLAKVADFLGIDGGYGTRPNGEPQIVATYDYRDEAGELVFQVVRYEPKDFRQRKPKDGGGCDVGQGGRVARTVREGRRVRLVAGRWHGRGVNAAG